MLSEAQKELLTAYVDGELHGHERRLAVRLLRRSPAARKLFRDLQQDSRQLAALPRQSAPADLCEQVVAHLPTREAAAVAATPSTLVREPERVPSWLGMAIAASVLFVVTLASYFYFAERPTQDGQGPIVAVKPSDEPKPNQPVERPPLLQFALKDFSKKKDIQKQFAEQLQKDTSLQIDLTTRSNGEAVKSLQKVFKDNSIALQVDARAQGLMEQGKKAKLLLFVEDLRPESVAKIMSDLARLQKTNTSAVETVALNPVSMDRRLEVAALLGLSLEQLQPAKKSERPKIDMTNFKDVALMAAPQKGIKPKTNPQPGPVQPEGMAVVLAYDIEGPSTSSEEIRNFLQARKGTRPDDTLQLVIILNETAV
jgi:hypothetical protein